MVSPRMSPVRVGVQWVVRVPVDDERSRITMSGFRLRLETRCNITNSTSGNASRVMTAVMEPSRSSKCRMSIQHIKPHVMQVVFDMLLQLRPPK